MSSILRTAVRCGVLAGLVLFLAACGAPTPTAAPTQDLNLLRTEVAATVLAQVPELCALTPTVTPTLTSTPTVTATPTATMTPTGQASAQPGTETAGLDRAQWVSQTVQDDTRYAPGAQFNMTWRILNAGQSTWTTAYRLRFYSGETFGTTREIFLDREVKPGEAVDITVPMTAPNKVGEYRSDWVMSNEQLRNFNQPVFLKIVVAAPATATVTAPAPTATTAAPATATTAPTPTSTSTP